MNSTLRGHRLGRSCRWTSFAAALALFTATTWAAGPTISSTSNMIFGGPVEIELGGTTPGSGNNNHDQINDSGTLTLLGSSTLKILPWNNFVPQLGDRFTIMTWQTGLDGTFGTTTIDPWFTSHGIASFDLQYTNTGGAGNLTVVAAPEPGTAVLLAAGALLGLGARRRQRRA